MDAIDNYFAALATRAAVIAESPPPPASQAHLLVTKTCSPNPAKAGDDVACTIVVTNKGPDTAKSAEFTDTSDLNDERKGQKTIEKTDDVRLEPNLLLVNDIRDLRFGLPDLAKGEQRQVTIVYKAVASSFRNSVKVFNYNTFDPGPATENFARVDVRLTTNPQPKVDAVNPNKGKPGATTTIEGSGLNSGQKKAQASASVAAAVATSTVVKFNGIAANILSITDTQIIVQVPAGATTGPVTVTTAGGTATSAQDFIVLPAIQQLLNISTRLKVLTGENVLIGGFIVTGNDDKKVLLRAIGPSLTSGGVAGALADPVLELHSGGSVVGTNDNWKSSQQAEIQATTIPPTNTLESAMVRTLGAHTTGYTAIVSGKGGASGVGLVEAYDLNQANSDSQLANISTRGFVDTEDNVMIGGVIVGGGASANTARVLVRGIGPSLGAAGVQGALQDPTLELHNSNGAVVAQNDNWQDTQKAEIMATTIPPTKDAESAIVRSLSAGKYTAILRGKSGTTGVALVELYNLQ
jgi:uncharacterized repeat protein (TIGR01451 family)